MKYFIKTVMLSSLLFIVQKANSQDLGSLHKCGELTESNEQLSIENWGYSYDDLLSDLEKWKQNPLVNIKSIGQSIQNRELWQLKITNNEIPDEGKRIVSIHARTHPNEVQAWWVTNAMIDQLLSKDLDIENLLENCIFYIIPMYNPDGVELEYPRENAHKIDIESNWNAPTVEPEVAALRSWFLSQMNSTAPIDIALNMHSAIACKRYFVYHDVGGTNLDYTKIEKRFIGDVGAHAMGRFQDWDYYVSWKNSTPKKYPESWFWLNYGQDVLALTYEDMNCDSAGGFEETASAILNGIADQFDINVTATPNINNTISSILVYPNPVSDVLSVDLQNQSTILSYTLLDFQGKIMLDKKGNIQNLVKIDFNNFESGVYVLRVKTEDNIFMERVICVK